MAQSGLFRPHGPLSVGSEQRVIISEIVDPELIWVHLACDKELLTKMMVYLQAKVADVETDVTKHQRVVVYYPEDRLWYRGEVTRCDAPDSCDVLYVDYGKRARAPLQYVSELPQEFQFSPLFAVPCALSELHGPKGVWTERDLEQLRSLFKPYEELLFRVSAESGGVFIGRFLDPATGVDLNRLFQQKLSAPPAPLLDAFPSPSHLMMAGGMYPMFPGAACGQSLGAGVSVPRIRAHAPPVAIIAQRYKDFPDGQFFDGNNRIVTKRVKMAYVNSPEDFYVLYSDDGQEKELAEVTEAMNTCYGEVNAAQSLVLQSLAPGTPCGALFAADSRWYRAVVLSGSNSDGVHVRFVDYGNEAKVPLEMVRALPASLGRLPPLALHCKLYDSLPPDGAWPISARTQMEELLECELSCIFRGVDGDRKYDVELMNTECSVDMPVLLSAALHKTGVALPQPISRPIDSHLLSNGPAEWEVSVEENLRRRPAVEYLRTRFPRRSLDEGAELRQIACPFSTGPDDFSLQLKEFLGQLNSVVHACEVVYVKAPELDRPPSFSRPVPRGSPSVAKFQEDRTWYRGEVLEDRGADGVLVLFVDFGNEALCNAEEVRKVQATSILATTPHISFRCRLPNLEKTPAWDKTVAQEFEGKLLDEHCFGRVLSHEADGVHTVELTLKNGQDLGALLVARGWAKRVGVADAGVDSETSWVRVGNLEPLRIPAEQGDSIEVVVSHIERFDRIYVQLKNETERINWICAELAKSDSDNQPSPPAALSKGDICAAKYNLDGRWYRGLVVEVLPSAYKVYFLDYGNSGDVAGGDVRHLPRSLSRSSPNAVRCRVRGLDAKVGVDVLERILESKTVSIKLVVGNEQEFVVDMKVESGGDGEWRELPALSHN